MAEHLFHCLSAVQPLAIQGFEYLPGEGDTLLGKTGALESDPVDHSYRGGISRTGHKRRNILNELGAG